MFVHPLAFAFTPSVSVAKNTIIDSLCIRPCPDLSFSDNLCKNQKPIQAFGKFFNSATDLCFYEA
jgi:hypothetical protein